MDIKFVYWDDEYFSKSGVFVYGQDIHIFYVEFTKLIGKNMSLQTMQVDKQTHCGYKINFGDAKKAQEIISRMRHPEWYNLQIVQKNTEELEKLQYQICPGKYFLQVMQEEFPNTSPFDVTKMVLQK